MKLAIRIIVCGAVLLSTAAASQDCAQPSNGPSQGKQFTVRMVSDGTALEQQITIKIPGQKRFSFVRHAAHWERTYYHGKGGENFSMLIVNLTNKGHVNCQAWVNKVRTNNLSRPTAVRCQVTL